ncbi:MAG: Kazal-type serine protease inhibitor family protein, partial [Cyanobacteria bacterium J06649_11]
MTCSYDSICQPQQQTPSLAVRNSNNNDGTLLSTLCVCPRCYDDFYQPVCGDNGESFASPCLMRRKNCLLKKEITMVKDVPCGMYDHVVYFRLIRILF